MLLLFKVLLFLLMRFFFSRAQLLSLNRTSILFLPPDGTLKINKDNLCGLLIIFQNHQSQLYIQQKTGRKLSISRWHHCWIKTISARITFNLLKTPPSAMVLIIFSHQAWQCLMRDRNVGRLKPGCL